MMTITNKFAGRCNNCGGDVVAGAGEARLTEKGWRVFCASPCEHKPAAVRQTVETKVGDLAGIMKLFEKASGHLKYPAIALDVPALDDFPIRINVAGVKAREPGSLTVLELERDGQGERPWLGRVSLSGHWQANQRADRRVTDAVGARLREFAAEPAKIAAEYGRLHGKCCFCRIALDDERSTAVGYGPTCAKNFGLPWGDRAAEFAGPAVPKVRKMRTVS